MIAFGPRSALKGKKEMNGATQQFTTTTYTKFLLDCVCVHLGKLSPRSRFKEDVSGMEEYY
jgi:hypothetical protein